MLLWITQGRHSSTVLELAMTPFWRNFLDAVAVLGFIILGTVIVHLIMVARIGSIDLAETRAAEVPVR